MKDAERLPLCMNYDRREYNVSEGGWGSMMECTSKTYGVASWYLWSYCCTCIVSAKLADRYCILKVCDENLAA